MICPQCNITFIKTFRRQLFCNKNCRKINAKNKRSLKNKGIQKINCKICNVIILKTGRRKIYCDNCKFIAKSNNYNKFKLKNKDIKKPETILQRTKRLLSVKKYKFNNKDKKLKYQKNYIANNIIKIRLFAKKYAKQKNLNDINFNLKNKVSHSIRLSLKKRNSSKNGESCLKYLPYTIEELKSHIESLFEPWMNWSNWGQYIVKGPNKWIDEDQSTWKWQLDHIIPHSEFNYTFMDCEEFKKCWSLSNLRPYNAKLNVKEGNRR